MPDLLKIDASCPGNLRDKTVEKFRGRPSQNSGAHDIEDRGTDREKHDHQYRDFIISKVGKEFADGPLKIFCLLAASHAAAGSRSSLFRHQFTPPFPLSSDSESWLSAISR